MALSLRPAGIFASRRARSLIALVCLGLLLIAVHIIPAAYLPARLDLPGERLYTLSRGTRQTLAHIDEPITLRLYYTTRLGDAVPSYGVYAQRVRELLDEYVAAAKGKLGLEVYTPQAFSDAEDRAVAFGLQSVPLDTQGEKVFFGLAGTNSTDDQQVIAFFAPERERLLEYDLTRLVHSLAVPKRTTVGLISSLPLEGDMTAAMRGRPSRPMAIIEQLRQLDKVDTLGLDIDAIPADIDVLMLVHPQNLSPKTLFAIDQFVLKGGKALIFVDPYSELQAGQRSRPRPPAPQHPPTAVQGLGAGAAADPRRRRPARGAPRRGAGDRPWPAGDRLRRLAQPARRRHQPRRCGHRRVAPAGDGLGRHPRTDRWRHEQARAAGHDLARGDEDPGR